MCSYFAFPLSLSIKPARCTPSAALPWDTPSKHKAHHAHCCTLPDTCAHAQHKRVHTPCARQLRRPGTSHPDRRHRGGCALRFAPCPPRPAPGLRSRKNCRCRRHRSGHRREWDSPRRPTRCAMQQALLVGSADRVLPSACRCSSDRSAAVIIRSTGSAAARAGLSARRSRVCAAWRVCCGLRCERVGDPAAAHARRARSRHLRRYAASPQACNASAWPNPRPKWDHTVAHAGGGVRWAYTQDTRPPLLAPSVLAVAPVWDRRVSPPRLVGAAGVEYSATAALAAGFGVLPTPRG